jgi:crossover junction endodeoxyribonuclease RuvC
MNSSVRILGLDPGLLHTGWGIIESVGTSLSFVAGGVIDPPVKEDFSVRLRFLHDELSKVIQTYLPDEAAIEETFVNKNPNSTLKLGMARGVVFLAPAMQNLSVFEYGANKVKKSVVGAGHADKHQVATMVKFLLPQFQSKKYDEADALAVAICHAHYKKFSDITAF